MQSPMSSPRVCIAAAVLIFAFGSGITRTASAEPSSAEAPTCVCPQASTESVDPPSQSRPLRPTYEPKEPPANSWYNSDYIFGMTRGVTGSTMHPAVKAPFLIFTLPLDIVLLPFTVIGGLFG